MSIEVEITKYVEAKDNNLALIREWLVDNIGPKELDIPSCRRGDGWAINFGSRQTETGHFVYSILIDFENEAEAVMFKLMWP